MTEDSDKQTREFQDLAEGKPIKIGPSTTLGEIAAKAFFLYSLGSKEPIQLMVGGGLLAIKGEGKNTIDEKRLILHIELTVREPS